MPFKFNPIPVLLLTAVAIFILLPAVHSLAVEMPPIPGQVYRPPTDAAGPQAPGTPDRARDSQPPTPGSPGTLRENLPPEVLEIDRQIMQSTRVLTEGLGIPVDDDGYPIEDPVSSVDAGTWESDGQAREQQTEISVEGEPHSEQAAGLSQADRAGETRTGTARDSAGGSYQVGTAPQDIQAAAPQAREAGRAADQGARTAPHVPYSGDSGSYITSMGLKVAMLLLLLAGGFLVARKYSII